MNMLIISLLNYWFADTPYNVPTRRLVGRKDRLYFVHSKFFISLQHEKMSKWKIT